MCKVNWKLKFISKSTMARIIKESIGFKIKKKKSMIMSKSSTIPLSLNYNIFFIHKGLSYRRLKITNYLIGFKFGEFVLTRKPFTYPKKIKKK